MEGLAAEGELLSRLVDHDVAETGDAALTHAARNDRRVGGHTAANRENTLGALHAGDILRRSLKADKDNLLASCCPSLCVLSREDNLTASRTRRCAEALAERLCLLERLLVELRVKQGVKVSRIDHCDRFLLASHALIDKIASNLERCLCGSLTVSGLQHVELAVLDGELHILHVSVVVLEGLADLVELLECLRELLLHLVDVHRGAHARNDVLTLCVGQELTEEALLARRRISRERNASAAVIAHVTECHGLHVDSRAPGVGDIVVAAVHVCARVVPGAEHSLDGTHQLLLRVGREVLAQLRLVLSLELVCELLEVRSGEIHVLGHAAILLHLVDELLKILLADFHNDVGVHLDKSSVAVPSPTRIVGLLCQDLDHVLVEAEVQDGVHHARHRSSCARANRDEKRILVVTELLAGDLLHLHDVVVNLRLDLCIDLAAVLVILRASLGRDREALRHRKTNLGHLRKVCALAAEELAHVRIALTKQINPFLCHVFLLLNTNLDLCSTTLASYHKCLFFNRYTGFQNVNLSKK